MSEIINLRKVRKAKARREEAAQAAANRERFGRSVTERDSAALEKQRTERILDGAKQER